MPDVATIHDASVVRGLALLMAGGAVFPWVLVNNLSSTGLERGGWLSLGAGGAAAFIVLMTADYPSRLIRAGVLALFVVGSIAPILNFIEVTNTRWPIPYDPLLIPEIGQGGYASLAGAILGTLASLVWLTRRTNKRPTAPLPMLKL